MEEKNKKKGITKKMQQQHALCLLMVCLRHPLHLLFPIFLHRCLKSCCFVCEKRWCQGEKRRVRSKCRQRRWKSWRKGIEIESVLEQFVSLLRTKSILLSFFSRRTVSEFVMCFSFRLHSLTSLSSSNKKRKLPWRRQSFFLLVNKVLEERQREGIKRKTLVQQQGSQNKTSDPTGHSCPMSFLLLHWLSVLLVLLLVYHCLVSDSRVSWKTLRDKRQCSCLSHFLSWLQSKACISCENPFLIIKLVNRVTNEILQCFRFKSHKW